MSAPSIAGTPALYWWAGTMTGHPRLSFPRRALCKLRAKLLRTPVVLPPVDTPPAEARQLARPTSTGLGDMLLAWLMPMTVARMMGWNLRIPVPGLAGGVQDDPLRARLNAALLSAQLRLPAHVSLADAEEIPADCQWFHTAEPESFVNACRETSFATIPRWIRRQLRRDEYLETHRQVAAELRAPFNWPDSPRSPAPPYGALHIRRRDKGDLPDADRLREIIRELSGAYRHWLVVSDCAIARRQTAELLGQLGCAPLTDPAAGTPGDAAERLFADFRGLIGAGVVVSSVARAWSAFPYAATSIGGGALLFTLDRSPVWEMLRAYSPSPIPHVYFGPAGASQLRRSAGLPPAAR